ncbi:MAG: Fe-S cluster assembly ATPase SufC [Alphaproteobacteria bacterium]
MTAILKIENLKVRVGGNEILTGLDLEIKPGEVHAIMGPNGSGKSTLACALSGKPGYEVSEGKVFFKGKNLLNLDANERAGEGLFLGFQYPVEIPGVSNLNFLRTALNAIKKYRGEEPVNAAVFLKSIREKAAFLDMDFEMQKRGVNVGFSGGEKKRNEMLQMLMLVPDFAVLDETDSGLDIDALKIVAGGINAIRGKEKGLLLITHYQRLLNYVEPDFVHVLSKGKIVKTGDKTLAQELEEKGYAEMA